MCGMYEERNQMTTLREAAAAALVKTMTTPPAWAMGLPLNAEVAAMVRYGKG